MRKDVKSGEEKLAPLLLFLEETATDADAAAFNRHPMMRYVVGCLAGVELTGLWSQDVVR